MSTLYGGWTKLQYFFPTPLLLIILIKIFPRAPPPRSRARLHLDYPIEFAVAYVLFPPESSFSEPSPHICGSPGLHTLRHGPPLLCLAAPWPSTHHFLQIRLLSNCQPMWNSLSPVPSRTAASDGHLQLPISIAISPICYSLLSNTQWSPAHETLMVFTGYKAHGKCPQLTSTCGDLSVFTPALSTRDVHLKSFPQHLATTGNAETVCASFPGRLGFPFLLPSQLLVHSLHVFFHCLVKSHQCPPRPSPHTFSCWTEVPWEQGQC